jgi:hypothetical protein
MVAAAAIARVVGAAAPSKMAEATARRGVAGASVRREMAGTSARTPGMAAAELTAMRGMALPTPALSKVSSLVVLNSKKIGALLRRGGRSSNAGRRTSEGKKRRPPVLGTLGLAWFADGDGQAHGGHGDGGKASGG